MARFHFNTFWTPNTFFRLWLQPQTPTGQATYTFGLTQLSAGRMSLWIFKGMGNVEVTADMESEGLLRHGFQPVAVIDRDAKTAEFVSHSVDHERHLGHLGAELAAQGYKVSAPFYAVTVFGARMERTERSRTGVPYAGNYRNTPANDATHRERARRNGSALMRFGETGERE